MSKMSELSQVLDDLVSCGEKLISTANAIRDSFGEKDATAPAAEASAPPSYTKEEVRALLAAKASEADGAFKDQVKKIVKAYADGGNLTDIPQERYGDLVKEVEGLKNA